MTRYFAILALSLAALPATALAAPPERHMGTPEQQRACRPDVLRHCRDVQGGDIAIANCLKDNFNKLSPACRRVFQ
jgi:Cysteine rich repeat